MSEKFCYQTSAVQELGAFLKDKIEKCCADSVHLSFGSMFRFSSCGTHPLESMRFVTKFSNAQDEFFYLDLNLTVLRYLFDCQLGFNQPIETSEEAPEELSELEIVSARPLLSEFSSLGTILFPASTDLTAFTPVCSGGSFAALNEKSDVKEESSYQIQLKYDLSIGTFLSTINIIVPVTEEEYRNAPEKFGESERKELSLVIKIGKTRIPLEDLKNLRKGDIIWTTIPADVLYTVEIEGVPAFHGLPGRYRDQMAIQIKGKGPAPFIPEK